jgi:hypothetical protein
MSSWLERFDALKAQAEDLASTAQREVVSRKAGSSESSSAQNLNARRNVMEMGRIISSMDKLANDNLCALPTKGCALHTLRPCLAALLPCHAPPQCWYVHQLCHPLHAVISTRPPLHAVRADRPRTRRYACAHRATLASCSAGSAWYSPRRAARPAGARRRRRRYARRRPPRRGSVPTMCAPCVIALPCGTGDAAHAQCRWDH